MRKTAEKTVPLHLQRDTLLSEQRSQRRPPPWWAELDTGDTGDDDGRLLIGIRNGLVPAVLLWTLIIWAVISMAK